jgi:putative inorganic carbon (hco3(-)) transporter
MSIFSINTSGYFWGAKRLDSPLAWIVMILAALAVGYVVEEKDSRIALIIVAGLIGGAAALVCLFNSRLGFTITTVYAFMMFYIKRASNDAVPAGVGVDVLIAVTFLGIYYRKTILQQRLWAYFNNPITYIYLIYIGFLFIELFNPSMYSVEGWLFTLRKFFNFVMIYFIGLHVFNSKDDVKNYIKLWMFLSILAGVYGCYQEWFGLLGFEEDWVMADPIRYKLYFQGGEMRKFSFLSDPTAYGILMAASVLMGIIFALNTKKTKQRVLLIIGVIFMALGMAYSGTRTAYFMIPAGLLVYGLMTITNRKTLLFLAGFFMIFTVVIFGPFYGNGTVNRIRTSFQFKDDESMNVRDQNRERIRPYMLSHPIGGGVATSGVLGLEYNPGHPLAGFPPDSGYLRSALETGWVGLAITMTMFFITLFVGVRNHYQCRTAEVRGIYVAIIASMYAYVVANYAQVAIGQIPGSFFFYSAMAIVVRLKHFEQPQLHSTDQIKSQHT